MTSVRPPLPLSAAAARLRRRPGRPPKPPVEAPSTAATRARIATGRPQDPPESRSQRGLDDGPGAQVTPALPPVAPLTPRLLNLKAAGRYIGLSASLVRELVAAGGLPRVAVPLPPDRRGRRKDGAVRKLLFDRVDLDQLIDTWKDRGAHA